MKVRVSGVPVEGLSFIGRAGRIWPRGDKHQVVEVIEADQDPDPKGWVIGQVSFRALQADRQIRIVPDGDPADVAKLATENEVLRARVAELEAENATVKHLLDQVTERSTTHTSEIEARREELASRVGELEAQVAALAATNAELGSKLAEASERKRGR
jgi:outer membrane murein-binding lipoprotein Lpp